MKLRARIFSTAILAALLAGAPLLAQDSNNINISYDHSYAFGKVKNYSWAKVETTDPMLEPRLTAAVDHMLQGLGWHPVDKNKNSTIAVSAVELDDATGYSRFYRGLTGYTWQRGWGNGGFADETASLRMIPAGTVVLDMYDPTTKKLVWRGFVSKPIAAKEKTKQDDVDKSVAAMFAKFPPKSGGPMAPNAVEVPASNSGVTTTGLRP